MRRALLGFAAAALVIVVAVLAFGGGDGKETYRVAVLFDTAKGMVSGQQVKVAGAPVGRVEQIDLAKGPKARMLLEIDKDFAPFHADASCSILPEGLISENYVECDPGSSRADLAPDPTGTPTVSLAHTTVPVSLQDVLNVFALPTSERLRLLISELGIATSGRGQDINALLRRANPALSASRDVLKIFASQREQIGTAIADTDRVLQRLGRQRGDVRAFVARANATARESAAHSGELGQAIHKLPGMLDAVRPGLRSLDRAATDATPLVSALDASGPGLARLTTTLPAFTRAGTPALKALSSVTRKGRPVLRRALPTAARLQRATDQLAPLVPDIDSLLVSLRQTGGIEGTMRILYTLAALTSTYDSTSHLINFIANVAPNCLAAEATQQDALGCSHKWSAPGQGTIPVNEPSCGPTAPQDLWRNKRCPLAVPLGTFPDLGALAPPPAKKQAKRPAKTTTTPTHTSTTPAAKAPELKPTAGGVQGVLDKLIGGLTGANQKPEQDKQGLLDFLLGN